LLKGKVAGNGGLGDIEAVATKLAVGAEVSAGDPTRVALCDNILSGRENGPQPRPLVLAGTA